MFKKHFTQFLCEKQSTFFGYFYDFKPDKGRSIIILNKHDYINSINRVIYDVSKYVAVDEPLNKFTFTIEDKINIFLLKLKNLKLISDDAYIYNIYSKLKVTGPGIFMHRPKM